MKKNQQIITMTYRAFGTHILIYLFSQNNQIFSIIMETAQDKYVKQFNLKFL